MSHSEEGLRRAILRLLTRRDHSQQELLQKLLKKGHAKEAIFPLLAEFVTVGYLDEARYTQNYIAARRRKGYGPERIMLELQSRGVAPEVIAKQLDITDNSWLIEIQRVWRKRFKSHAPHEFKDRAKQMRFLQYRGFTQEQIETLYEK
ncbi:MAG TPA: regulatory protein RecX [Gammaproteobacteria bacterium]|jgi:regulatory protein|nr:regulatory protein RecX [Gammaproteobacteria bacterium]